MTPRQLKTLDAAFESLFGDKKPTTPTAVEELQNRIEDMGFVLADRQELVDALQDINKNLVTRNQDLQSTKDTLQQDRDAAVARATSLESDVRRLQRRIAETETEQQSKRDRLAELQSEHNTYVNETAGVINRWAMAAQTEKGNAEHLAKQAIRLQRENQKLMDDAAKAKCLVKENQTLRNLVRFLMDGLCNVMNVTAFFFGAQKAKKLAYNTYTEAERNLDTNNIQV